MAIVKTFTVFNTTAGAGTVDIQLTDTSASATHAIRHFDATAYAGKSNSECHFKWAHCFGISRYIENKYICPTSQYFCVGNGGKR